jgi:hypothetical protein
MGKALAHRFKPEREGLGAPGWWLGEKAPPSVCPHEEGTDLGKAPGAFSDL